MICFLRIRRPPRSTRTDTLFPYTTLFRSGKPEDHQTISTSNRPQLVIPRTCEGKIVAAYPKWWVLNGRIRHLAVVGLDIGLVALSLILAVHLRVSGDLEPELVDGLYLAVPIFARSEEHTSELQSLMRISYAVF